MKHEAKKKDLYDDNNVKLSEGNWGMAIEKYWKDIYQKHSNNIVTYWNEEKKENYSATHTYAGVGLPGGPRPAKRPSGQPEPYYGWPGWPAIIFRIHICK